MITIKPVHTSRDKQDFINVPKKLYKNDPHWIAPLDLQIKNQLNPKKNPTFKNMTHKLWVAYDNDVLVGRISAQLNHLHHKIHHHKDGHFGFLDAHSFEIMKALITTAENWLLDQGMTQITGPFSFSINEQCGLLVDGFNTPPYFLMSHHPPQYQEWLQKLGFSNTKDLLSFNIHLPYTFPKRWHHLIKKLPSKKIKTRKINMSNYSQECDEAFRLWNDSAQNNWGFLPMTPGNITHLKTELKPILDPDTCIFSEHHGQKTGMMIAIPNINEAINGLNGRLLPWGWLILLYRLKIKKIKTYRLILGGLDSQIQSSHLGGQSLMLILDTLAHESHKKGITNVECSWILEDNTSLLKVLAFAGLSTAYKRYRIFSKQLKRTIMKIKDD